MNIQKASIPKPCSYDWNKMIITDDNKRRHCNACDQIVVDYTVMTTEELQRFLVNYEGTNTCGHFKTIDTDVGITWFQSRLLNFHNKIDSNINKTILKAMTLFLIASLLTVTGCRTRTTGKPPSINNTKSLK